MNELPTMTPDQMAELAARLYDFGKAYPVEIFPEITDAERAEHSRLITRAAAQMGRHFAKFAVPAADLIERMAQREPLTDEQIYQAIDAARRSYRAHTTGIRGQMLTIYDDMDWHLVRAVEQAHGIRSEK